MSSERQPEVVSSAAYHDDTDDEYDFKTSSRLEMMDYDVDTDQEDFATPPSTEDDDINKCTTSTAYAADKDGDGAFKSSTVNHDERFTAPPAVEDEDDSNNFGLSSRKFCKEVERSASTGLSMSSQHQQQQFQQQPTVALGAVGQTMVGGGGIPQPQPHQPHQQPPYLSNTQISSFPPVPWPHLFPYHAQPTPQSLPVLGAWSFNGNQAVAPSPRPSKRVKTNEDKEKKKPQCSICVDFNGVYSSICPGKYLKKNCCFFHPNGTRKLCLHCKQKNCDGGESENGLRCRSERGTEIRMCEELDYCKEFWPQCPSSGHVSLPQPPPLDNIRFPSSSTCLWSVDVENRTVLADFRGVKKTIRKEDLECLLTLYERNDIAVISRGLAKNTVISSNSESSPEEYHHLTTALRESGEFYNEKDVTIAKESIKEHMEGGTVELCRDDMTLESFLDYHMGEQSGAGRNLYLIDYRLSRFEKLWNDFKRKFLIPEILPGGEKCLLSSSTARDLDSFGPLIYAGVGGAFTPFHEDGLGTVDSGHLCLTGYNDVVILRRLESVAREDAADKLGISLGQRPNVMGVSNNKFSWPSKEKIESLKKLGYCPILLTLGPGDHLHIGKSRIHAFRKVDFRDLDKNDCHYDLREKLKAEVDPNQRDCRCTSFAWDWQFMGHSAMGVARELSTSLKAHNLSSHLQRDGSAASEQILGKAMYFTISLANKLFQKSKYTKESELKTMCGLLPVLKVAKNSLQNAEEYLNGKNIKDDADEGLGPSCDEFERYECASCFAELWSYYVEAISKETNDLVCVCIQCVKGHSDIFDLGKNAVYKRRMRGITSGRLDEMIEMFDSLLQEKTSSWWQSAITDQLLENYNSTHQY